MTSTYLRKRRAKLRERAMKGVAARERLRIERVESVGNWQKIGVLLVAMKAAPDGKHMAIAVHGRLDWTICGTERAVRSALARAMWKRFKVCTSPPSSEAKKGTTP